MDRASIHTIGHSNHTFQRFVDLLAQVNMNAIADVRTSPYSRWAPHFGKDKLKSMLAEQGVAYVFLGSELGGRPADRRLYTSGTADYEAMARSRPFLFGIERLMVGANSYRLALMCSEQEPLDCHRCLLVGRHLASANCKVVHILGNGTLEDHNETEARLLRLEGLAGDDLFSSREQRLALAYRERGKKVAFSEGSDARQSGAT